MLFWTTDRTEHGLPHDPFKAIVAPRPIGWISTRSRTGAVNLAPYSFFAPISDHPKLVLFASTGFKDAATAAIESGEFVANLATGPLARAVVKTSAAAPRGVSEFSLAGLTEAPCRLVSAPRVAEAPAALECRVTQWFHPETVEGPPSDAVVVIGQVIGIHLDERVLTDGRLDARLARPLSRLGYLDYAETAETFSMPRPKRPDASDV